MLVCTELFWVTMFEIQINYITYIRTEHVIKIVSK